MNHKNFPKKSKSESQHNRIVLMYLLNCGHGNFFIKTFGVK